MSDEKTPEEIALYQETIGGSLIDAARIAVNAALAVIPLPPKQLIVVPGQEQPDPMDSVHGCLEIAMDWLDAARQHTVVAGVPVTSLHGVERK